MINLLLAGAGGGIFMYFVMLFSFKCYIEKASAEQKPTEAFGKTYFMMQQWQIQNAVKAIYLLERHNGEKVLCFEEWHDNDPKALYLIPDMSKNKEWRAKIEEEIMDLQNYTWNQAVKLQRTGLKK